MLKLSVDELTRALEAYRVRNNLTKSALAKLMSVPAPSLKGWIAEPGLPSFSRPSHESAKLIENFLSSVGAINGTSSNDSGSLITATTKDTYAKKADHKRDTPERIARLRQLFILIAPDLEALRLGNESDRELYRNMLDPRDLGYLSSLMAMLSDEAQFRRWQQFNTYRFQQFKGGRDE